MISRILKAAGVSTLALLVWTPTPSTAQFGVGGNRRKGGAASFEELNKLAAERAAGGGAAAGGAGMAGFEDLLGGMDLGALMEGLDPNTLQELIAEGMKDPAVQEMVSCDYYLLHLSSSMTLIIVTKSKLSHFDPHQTTNR